MREGARLLAEAGIDNPRLESRLLLAHAVDRTSEDLIRDLAAEADPGPFFALVSRRVAHEPMALILGWREFWSLRFQVSPATLIPRPDSETVVEAALTLFPDPAAPVRVLDLGTGTGCLLLAFLHERPLAFGVGADLSAEAARLARRNAFALGLGDRSAFLCGDWACPIGARFDLVLSNPPYIETEALVSLMPEVSAYEPRAALDGGITGLTAYRAIIDALPRLLTTTGAAVLELGFGQQETVAGLANAAGYRTDARFDLSGTARVLILRPHP
ncbi:MAG: peptide chain release factor N(5)-glutamine methyltransferase [Acetobacteraceae bacterium]|nr:peptide chain release factor N(5)-glutamine methyltransferase [Acetobacteraceae bacterium]